MDKLTSMKVFVAVAQRGSFSAAAEELDMSKAMVSKYVRYLENLLGARLLNRNTRHLTLTPVGAAYCDRCKQILAEVEETELLITQLNSEPKGTLKVTAPTSFTFYLTPAIADYQAMYPDANVHLTLNDQFAGLVEKGFDVGVRVGKLPESSLIARKLADVRLVVCGAPAYFERHVCRRCQMTWCTTTACSTRRVHSEINGYLYQVAIQSVQYWSPEPVEG
jgi:DNA-binding transcriptional LysR family regulator